MSALRVGVDARALAPPITGTGVYLRELLRELRLQRPDLELVLYSTRRPAAGSVPEGSALRLGEGPSSRWGTLWLQTTVPALTRRDRVDLFWGPLQVLPRRLIGRLPTVVTVHDLVFRRYPETMSWRNRLVLGWLAAQSMRGADQVIAVSETTARDAIPELDLEPKRVTVVRNAVSSEFAPLGRDQARQQLRAWLESRPDSEPVSAVQDRPFLDRDILLFVGTLEPRKNLLGLLEALARINEGAKEDRFDGEVWIVGGAGWRNSSLSSVVERHPLRSRLRLLGYVEPELLPALYSAARLFVMPSLYEGFGLPVIEAMSCGAPVVCSNRDPFPEVAGLAAAFFSPVQPREMAETIATVWNDSRLRSSLRERGLAHAATFRWADSARALLEVFDRAVARRR